MDKFIQNKEKVKDCLQLIKNITIVILFSLYATTSMAVPSNVNALALMEQMQEKKITLKLTQKSLEDILVAICKQAKIVYTIKDGVKVDNSVKYSIEVTNVSAFDALTKLFSNTKYTFSVNDDKLLILLRDIPSRENITTSTVSVKGYIIDEDKKPIVGATVIILGTTQGAITDDKGCFFVYPTVGSKIEVSMVGFKSIAKVVSKREDNLIITLEKNILSVEDVVVTGYQTIDRRKNTGAVQTLKMDDIDIPGVMTIDNLLESKVPGMIFMQNSGQVGAAPKIRIRGTSTVLGNQEPLWVLDGVVLRDPVNVNPQLINNLDFVNLVGNAISGINPDDIERIDILKDASSTALYGAKAANGVIVISTKKGKQGPPSVSYSFNGKMSSRPRYSNRNVNMMNSKERIDFSREIIEKKLQYPSITNWVGYEGALKDLYDGSISQTEFDHRVARLETINTDWFDLMTEDTFSHSHTFSLSGGGSNVRYYTSLSYSDENGVIKGESNERYTASMNITGNHNRFQYSFGFMANKGDRSYASSELNVLDYAYNSSRAIPAYNEDGSLHYYNKIGSSQASDGKYLAFNALNEMQNFRDNYSNFGVNINANIAYKLADYLNLQGTFGYSISANNQDSYIGESTFYAANLRGVNFGADMTKDEKSASLLPYGGEYREQYSNNNNYTARIQADFNKYLDANLRHFLNASLGYEVSSSKYTGKTETHRCFLPERGKTISEVNMADYGSYANWKLTDTGARGVFSDNIRNELSAYFTTTYTFDNTYSVNFNTRADASNKFGSRSNEKILPVWSISFSWDAKEKSLSNVKWISELNFRGSFGYQGNMLDSQTPELIIKKGSYNGYFDEYQSSIQHYPNPNLKWEKTNAYNISADFSFFNNRIRGTVSYFYKKTVDAFLSKAVSDINGVEDYVINSGNIENKGFELSFNFTPIKSSGKVGGFRWDIDPQFGQVVNSLLSKAINNNNFDDRDKREIMFSDYLNGSALIEGKPLNSFYSYKYAGLSGKDGRPLFHDIDEELKDKYIKMDREAVYRAVMDYSGTRVPVIQGGISNTFSYKRMSLGINFSYSFGSKIRLLNLYGSNSNGTTIAPLPERNARAEFNDRWRTSGDEKITNVPGLLSNKEYGLTMNPWWIGSNYNAIRFSNNIWQMYDNSNLRTVSGNYLKLQSVSFNYSIPESVCKKLYLKSAHIAFSGYNLFTICDKALKGQDPTQSGTSDKINLSLRPNYSLSVGITF